MSVVTKARIGLALAAALLMSACGGTDSIEDRERAMEDLAAKHGIDVDVKLSETGDTKQVVVNTAGGQVGTGLELPPGFPNDVIVPSDWNIMAANSPMPQNYMVQALTKDSVNAVLETVRQEMSQAGWTEAESSQMTPQMSRVSFEKDDRLTAYTITQNGETQLVQVVSMPKP
ncbi:hypothetical protein RYZ27_08970 [Hyphomonas sp. FCG-A18]|uniref:hypothetical protein n=1 Tax=Hyphomonas sp. FCG-A18 TaxID=3080019 RepID=UPI002B2DACD0|nr:hypothetical protein RYZ27_08970 [Hyphomonas sp. FCG-A18]